MSGYRQAALYLHGLHRDDQDWLLNRLPGTQRLELQTLLEELCELGIPQEEAISVLDEGPLEAGNRLSAVGDHDSELDRVDPGSILAILKGESDVIVNAVLTCRRWSWRAPVARKLKKNLADTGKQAVLPPKLEKALLAALVTRVRKVGERQNKGNVFRMIKRGKLLWRQ